MAISWTSAVALANRIASDVPAVKTMLDALAKMDFTGITSIPANVKRIASVTGGVQLQKYASNAWSSIGKLMHDVDTVDGFHAGTGTTKNTIPVRDANGALPGNITGNAATASKASALADGYTVPLAKGGTGATTAAARVNLGADNAANITKGTLPTARGGTGRTDGFVTDVVIDASGTKASEVGQLGRAKSLSRVDANTILKHGRYNVYYATTALHFPLPGDLLLDVIVWGDDNIMQICSSPSKAYQWEMARSSYDGGATWGGWLPRSGFLNADIHIYVSKDGDDTNAGYSADKPVLTVGMAAYKMLMMKPGIGKSFYLHFGPGEWGNMTLYASYASGATVVVTSLAAANSAAEPADMPKFGTIVFSRSLLAYVRNIEADMVDSSYDACTYFQYYNKIGALRPRYNGRILFEGNSVTGIKAQTVQPTAFANLYRHGSLDIFNGATFDILENITYSGAFLYAVDYSKINIGSTITAASFKNAARVTGKKFHFVSTEIVDSNTRRTLLPGNTAGTYGNGNLINGMATDITVDGTPSDTAVKRGQIGACPHFTATVKKDIDTLADSGSYSLNNNDGLHLPEGVNFYVDVMSSSHGFVRQVLYRQGTVGTNDHRVFTRESADRGKTWGDYARFLMDKDMAAVLTNDGAKVPSSAAVYNTALLKNGGTLTGNLLFPVNEDDADVKTLRLGIRAADTDGTVRTFFPFRIIPGSTNGRGLVLCPAGPIILGGGESAQTFAKGHIGAGNLNGETEYTFITSDSGIEFYYGQNAGYDAAKKIAISSAGNISMPGTITASKFNGCATGLGARDFADAQSGTNSPSVVYGLHPDGKIRPFALDRIVPLSSKLVPDWGGRATRVLNTYYSETVNGLLFLHWSIGTSWKYLKFLIANNDGTYGEYEIAHSYNSASANGSMTIPIEKGRSYGFFAKNGDGKLITDISITCRFMKTK